ncbi:MAG TPA: DUF6491 family protein [Steroidobacteraceae bacterium]|nr:DUF6491 family protein [Steroidobacteraceae bacterium]
MKCHSRWLALGVALAGLGACAHIWPAQPSDAERRADYAKYAGPPLESFTYLRHYYGWQPLGKLQLVVWTDIDDAYLIRVLPPCIGLDFVSGVGFTNQGGLVTRGVDAVTFGRQYCFIAQIRHVDYLAMKKAINPGP